jgi:hypothetical protein
VKIRLEKNEGAIRNGQFRETCNVGPKMQNGDKNSHTTHKTNEMSNANWLQ